MWMPQVGSGNLPLETPVADWETLSSETHADPSLVLFSFRALQGAVIQRSLVSTGVEGSMGSSSTHSEVQATARELGMRSQHPAGAQKCFSWRSEQDGCKGKPQA